MWGTSEPTVTQTNKDGDFRLGNVRPGRTTVSAFRLGYKAVSDTVRLEAAQTVSLNMTMVASLVTLSEVVVTGTAGNQERRAQSAQVASVNAAQVFKDAPVSLFIEADGNFSKELGFTNPGVDFRLGVQFAF